jgi:hypothetical protein
VRRLPAGCRLLGRLLGLGRLQGLGWAGGWSRGRFGFRRPGRARGVVVSRAIDSRWPRRGILTSVHGMVPSLCFPEKET